MADDNEEHDGIHKSDNANVKSFSADTFSNNIESERAKMMLKDIYSTEEAEAISVDVAKLANYGVIDKALCGKLKFEKLGSSTIPLYAAKSVEH